jgi:hypothetical protein
VGTNPALAGAEGQCLVCAAALVNEDQPWLREPVASSAVYPSTSGFPTAHSNCVTLTPRRQLPFGSGVFNTIWCFAWHSAAGLYVAKPANRPLEA